MIKKTYLAWIINSSDYETTIKTNKDLIEELKKNFEKIYLINFYKLRFFRERNNKKIPNESKEIDNLQYFCPETFSDLKIFFKDKKIIGILNMGRKKKDFKVHLILNLFDVKLIQTSNIGNVQWSHNSSPNKNLLDIIRLKLEKKFFPNLINLMSLFGLVPKVEIRFITNKPIIENIKNNKFKSLLYKFNFFYAKELILINSRTYDYFSNEKMNLSEDYILLLDSTLNNSDTLLADQIDMKNIFDNHYILMLDLLRNLEKKYKKKVIISLHPSDDLKMKKNFFSDYEVIKFKTRELISKAFLVIYFDSSAIVDAIYLKKRILSIKSKALGKLSVDGSNKYSSQVGIYQIPLVKDLEIDNILPEIDKRTPGYEKYIFDNINSGGNEIGSEKIIRIIKKRFF